MFRRISGMRRAVVGVWAEIQKEEHCQKARRATRYRTTRMGTVHTEVGAGLLLLLLACRCHLDAVSEVHGQLPGRGGRRAFFVCDNLGHFFFPRTPLFLLIQTPCPFKSDQKARYQLSLRVIL